MADCSACRLKSSHGVPPSRARPMQAGRRCGRRMARGAEAAQRNPSAAAIFRCKVTLNARVPPHPAPHGPLPRPAAPPGAAARLPGIDLQLSSLRLRRATRWQRGLQSGEWHNSPGRRQERSAGHSCGSGAHREPTRPQPSRIAHSIGSACPCFAAAHQAWRVRSAPQCAISRRPHGGPQAGNACNTAREARISPSIRSHYPFANGV
jgi:hypothetical protein